MKKSLWALRFLFLALCTTGGLLVNQVRPEFVDHPLNGLLIGFGLGWVVIAIDEMLKGVSIRIFSAASVGLGLGLLVALLVESSEIFKYVDDKTVWMIRVALYLAFGYLGMILAMRSNKEDFSLLIPFVRFAPQRASERLLLLDTSAVIDGRIADLVEVKFAEGVIVVPRFVLKELQQIADSADPLRRARGRRGLEMLGRLQGRPDGQVKIHEADIPEETGVDAKLIRLAKLLGAQLFTTDYNLAKTAELQGVSCVNLNELAAVLKSVVLPGDAFTLKIVREGKDKGQGVGFLGDGTMVVVADAATLLNQQTEVQVTNVVQTGAGKLIFASLRPPAAA
ncbi:MAG TPA: PIN domain-containing protein [Verrucomicrobiae bacterium]|jgi:uncharacterized protein YacL